MNANSCSCLAQYVKLDYLRLLLQALVVMSETCASSHGNAVINVDVSSSSEIEIIESDSDSDGGGELERIPSRYMVSVESRASAYGISDFTWNVLVQLGAPVILFNLLFVLNLPLRGRARPADFRTMSGRFMDIFPGVGRIGQEMTRRGLTCFNYDINLDATYNNILSNSGFVTLLQHVMMLEPGRSGTHWGTVCSSWVFMSR